MPIMTYWTYWELINSPVILAFCIYDFYFQILSGEDRRFKSQLRYLEKLILLTIRPYKSSNKAWEVQPNTFTTASKIWRIDNRRTLKKYFFVSLLLFFSIDDQIAELYALNFSLKTFEYFFFIFLCSHFIFYYNCNSTSQLYFKCW